VRKLCVTLNKLKLSYRDGSLKETTAGQTWLLEAMATLAAPNDVSAGICSNVTAVVVISARRKLS
jgi:hypothetical protein